MKLLQVRGGHASGKTETVRQFLYRHENHKEIVKAGRFESEITITNTGVVVLGQYADTGCGGVDRWPSDNYTERLIRTLIAVAGPETIIFEAMIFGRRYKSTKEIINVATDLGYTYHGLLIERDLKQRTELIVARNGGKAINRGNFIRSANDARKSSMRLRQDGYRVDIVNVTDFTKEQMGDLIEQRI